MTRPLMSADLPLTSQSGVTHSDFRLPAGGGGGAGQGLQCPHLHVGSRAQVQQADQQGRTAVSIAVSSRHFLLTTGLQGELGPCFPVP